MANAQATLTHGAESVTFDLLDEAGNLAVARDVRKGELKIYTTGEEDAHAEDNFSAGNSFTLVGILSGSNAYADAKTLAENIIKPRPAAALSLDLTDMPGMGTYDVVPVGESACQIMYDPGERNLVRLQITLTNVRSLAGGTQDAQTYPSPDAGSGVKIERNGTSVTLHDGLQLTRTVGRPNVNVQASSSDSNPKGFDMNKPATDVFEFSGMLKGSNPGTTAATLEEDIIRDPLGDRALTLHFLDNLYSLDAYPVMPVGGQALRTVRSTAEKDMVGIPALRLRVVSNSASE